MEWGSVPSKGEDGVAQIIARRFGDYPWPSLDLLSERSLFFPETSAKACVPELASAHGDRPGGCLAAA